VLLPATGFRDVVVIRRTAAGGGQTRTVSRIGRGVAIAAASAGVVWLGWRSGSTDPAARIGRIGTTATVLMLASLAWAGRPGPGLRRAGPAWAGRRHGAFGPADDNWARAVRAGGYTATFALLAVMTGLSGLTCAPHERPNGGAGWNADIAGDAVRLAVTVFVVLGGYAAAILRMTARRSPVAPASLRIGAGSGVMAGLIVYGLTPRGGTLHITSTLLAAPYYGVLLLAVLGAPTAAGWFAARRTPDLDGPDLDGPDPDGPAAVEGDRIRQSTLTGLCAGTAAALVITTLTLATVLLASRHLHPGSADPDPDTACQVAVDVGDTSARYLGVLLFGPLLGVALGVIGGGIDACSTT
jgi:hypothetical protein